MMDEAGLRELAADIRQNGLLEPIILYDNMILDGRNRLAACKRVAVDPRFHTPKPPITDPYTYVLSKNLRRRHLDRETRTWITAMTMPQLMEEARKRQGTRTDLTSVSHDTEVDTESKSRQQAAELADVSESTIQRAWEVQKADPELAEVARKNKVPPARAKRALKDPELRKELLAGGNGKKSSIHKDQKPKEERIRSIKELAAKGYHDTQIAKELGITVGHVRNLANEAGIALPHKLIGTHRAIDVNRVLEETVISARGLASTIDLLDGRTEKVDRTRIPDWISSLEEARATLGRIIRILKGVTANDNGRENRQEVQQGCQG